MKRRKKAHRRGLGSSTQVHETALYAKMGMALAAVEGAIGTSRCEGAFNDLLDATEWAGAVEAESAHMSARARRANRFIEQEQKLSVKLSEARTHVRKICKVKYH